MYSKNSRGPSVSRQEANTYVLVQESRYRKVQKRNLFLCYTLQEKTSIKNRQIFEFSVKSEIFGG